MATVLIVRHARTTANAAGVLAGWSPGVFLDEVGQTQAAQVAERIASAGIPVRALVSSPLDRCVQTADLIAAQCNPTARTVDARLGECGYGAWTGRPLAELAKDPLWRQIQDAPSSVRFPDAPGYAGESFPEMRERAVAAVRDHDAAIETEFGADAIWVAVSHGDIVKLILADALATPLDEFQRIHVDPASISVIRYAGSRPMVLRVNDRGGDLSSLVPAPAPTGAPEPTDGAGHGRHGDAIVGGGAG